jgi:hypothetical protein
MDFSRSPGLRRALSHFKGFGHLYLSKVVFVNACAKGLACPERVLVEKGAGWPDRSDPPDFPHKKRKSKR